VGELGLECGGEEGGGGGEGGEARVAVGREAEGGRLRRLDVRLGGMADQLEKGKRGNE